MIYSEYVKTTIPCQIVCLRDIDYCFYFYKIPIFHPSWRHIRLSNKGAQVVIVSIIESS